MNTHTLRSVASAVVLTCAGFLSLATDAEVPCWNGIDKTRTLDAEPTTGETTLHFDAEADFAFLVLRPAVKSTKLVHGAFITAENDDSSFDEFLFDTQAPSAIRQHPLCPGVAGGMNQGLAGGGATGADEGLDGLDPSACVIPVFGGQETILEISTAQDTSTRVTFHVGGPDTCEDRAEHMDVALRIVDGVR